MSCKTMIRKAKERNDNSMPDAMKQSTFTISGPTMNDGVATRKLITVRKSIIRGKCIFFLLLSLLIILAVVITAGILCYRKTSKELQSPVCTSKECLTTAANLYASMNLSMNPCDDFYSYTCGKWSEEHIDHGWFPHFSNSHSVMERVLVTILDFLKSPGSDDEPLPVRQSRDLYKSCMDENSINEKTYSAIIKHLNIAGLPLIPKIFITTKERHPNYKFDWIKADVNIKKTLHMDLFVGFEIVSNQYNRNENLIFLRSARKSSPLPISLQQEMLRMNSEEIYKEHAKQIIELILEYLSESVHEDVIDDAVDVLWNVKEKLEKLHGSIYYPQKKQIQANVSSLEDMTTSYLEEQGLNPGEIERNIWTRYLTLLFKGIPDVELNLEENDFIYYEPSELDSLIGGVYYLTESSAFDIELYAWYQTIYTMFNSAFLQAVTVSERSKNCADIVENLLPFAVSYGIVDKTFLSTTKPKIDNMLENMKKAFDERVKSFSWMDTETKNAVLDKNAEMLSFIGYPDWLFDENKLEAYYKDIIIRDNTYLENLISIIRRYTPRELSRLREKRRRDWLGNPMCVNAFHYPGQNSIHIPLGILAFPFYNLGLEVLNYGAIGTILGHEITHGFDNRGRKYDRCGNCAEWWNIGASSIFDFKAECFVKQYNDLTLPNIKIPNNGRKTLGENIADNGGVNQAFLAYKKYVEKNGTEQRLPGFEDYSYEQLFFIAYAHSYCGSQNKEILINQLKTGDHSPDIIRVTGSLQNSEEFSKAFNCQVGTKMNPDRERCVIW